MEDAASYDVYKDISARTGGEIYIGVVGPVRTGKSTFIKRFMNLFVIPNMEEGKEKEQAKDELPQSAGGKMIMTTEPKFIPKEAALITLNDQTKARVRLIDCVGYMVNGASGHEENEKERMVKTPWFDEEIPFTKAAEIGTKKVIRDHSSIGIVMMGDGSFGELSAEDFYPALEKTVAELKEQGKPFVVLLNCVKPYSEEAAGLANQIREKLKVSVVCANCEQLRKEDVSKIMGSILKEFPLKEIRFFLPKWLEMLPDTHPLKEKTWKQAKNILKNASRMKDMDTKAKLDFEECKEISVLEKDAGNGTVSLEFVLKPEAYFKTVSEYSGLSIENEQQMLTTFFEMAAKKEEIDHLEQALLQVRGQGYGVVRPNRSDITLDEPVLIRQGGKFGVRMKASAPSIHMIRANIETEIAPIVGSEEQANDLIRYIKDAAVKGEDEVFMTNIFGKTIEQIVTDGMDGKISQMTEECRQKLQDALAKIINDSNGGMVCIII